MRIATIFGLLFLVNTCHGSAWRACARVGAGSRHEAASAKMPRNPLANARFQLFHSSTKGIPEACLPVHFGAIINFAGASAVPVGAGPFRDDSLSRKNNSAPDGFSLGLPGRRSGCSPPARHRRLRRKSALLLANLPRSRRRGFTRIIDRDSLRPRTCTRARRFSMVRLSQRSFQAVAAERSCLVNSGFALYGSSPESRSRITPKPLLAVSRSALDGNRQFRNSRLDQRKCCGESSRPWISRRAIASFVLP